LLGRNPSKGRIAATLSQRSAVFFLLPNTFRNLQAGLWRPNDALNLCVHVYIIFSQSLSLSPTHSLSIYRHTHGRSHMRTQHSIFNHNEQSNRRYNVEFNAMETRTRKPTHPHTNPPPPTNTRTHTQVERPYVSYADPTVLRLLWTANHHLQRGMYTYALSCKHLYES